jgi:hypothetical protein
MSNRLQSPDALHSPHGELISVQLGVEPKLLEQLLDCLASVPFPINPQIYHGRPTIVEFPAYVTHLPELHSTLRAGGFDPAALRVCSMLRSITAA